jgi:sirohydrochlorin ferrochelatase
MATQEQPQHGGNDAAQPITQPLALPAALKAALAAEPKLGIIIIDHGSRRQESNLLLEEVARHFQQATGAAIVEPAHMELAEPTLDQAFDRCVAAGAQKVVVQPYFLGPGRHWEQDIPALAAAAAARHPGIAYRVAAPLGLHPLMLQLIAERVAECLDQAQADGGSA